MTTMRSGTKHTVTVSAQLSPGELRASYTARCVVKLKGRRRWFPQFMPVWNRTLTIGKAYVLLEHNKKEFPILVVLPKTRHTTEFGVFVEILGKEYVSVDPIIVLMQEAGEQL